MRAVSATPAHGGARLALNALAGGLANLVKIGVNLVMLPLMAHLLGPAEFGLYALALPTIAFCMILADGGLAASLAREPLESRLIWSTGFWLVAALGLSLSLAVTACGSVLARLTHEPRVGSLIAMLSLSLVMISLSAVPSARLTREARLAVFAAADLLGNLAGAAVAVGLALKGFGAKSLAAQYVVSYTLRAMVLNAVAFVPPRFEFQLAALKDHLWAGGALLGVRMADFVGRIVESTLYGRMFGASELGLYTFANQAPRFLTEAASGPIWGALYAFALREPPERLARMRVNLARLLASLVFPAAALLSATAPALLVLILGPNWRDAGELLRWLAPFYAIGVISDQSGAVLAAQGRSGLWFFCALGLMAGRTAAVALGGWSGRHGVVVGVDAALALNALAMVWIADRRDGARRLRRATAPAAAASLLAGAAAFATLPANDPNAAALIRSTLLGGGIYLVALGFFGRQTVSADFALARKLFSRFLGRRAAFGEE